MRKKKYRKEKSLEDEDSDEYHDIKSPDFGVAYHYGTERVKNASI